MPNNLEFDLNVHEVLQIIYCIPCILATRLAKGADYRLLVAVLYMQEPRLRTELTHMAGHSDQNNTIERDISWRPRLIESSSTIYRATTRVREKKSDSIDRKFATIRTLTIGNKYRITSIS